MVTKCDAVVAFSYLFFDHSDPKIGINLLPQHNLSNSVPIRIIVDLLVSAHAYLLFMDVLYIRSLYRLI